MNLRDLKYFLAVCDHKHFGRAAEANFVSQPALSMQLQKLEQELGVQLFERRPRDVRLTDAGQAIAGQARRVLQAADDLRTLAQSFHDPLAGQVRLGIFPTLGPYYLPHIVPRLHRALPKLTLLLREEKTDRLIDLLDIGELDAAILALPLDGTDLMQQALFDDPFLLAVPKTHPLARQATVTLNDVNAVKLLLLEDGHCLRDQVLAACAKVGSRDYQEFRATSLETLKHMVAAEVGATLIPQSAATPNDMIRYLPFGPIPPYRRIALVWRRSSAKTQCLAAIASLLADKPPSGPDQTPPKTAARRRASSR